MQVILTKEIHDLGQAGETVKVRPGFGANFLIPRGLAVLATGRNQRQIAHEQRRIEALVVRERAAAQDVAKKLNGVSVGSSGIGVRPKLAKSTMPGPLGAMANGSRFGPKA